VPSPAGTGGSSAPLEVIKKLDSATAIGADKVALFHDLRVLRNQAAHTQDDGLTPELALRYVDLAQSLAQALDAANNGDNRRH